MNQPCDRPRFTLDAITLATTNLANFSFPMPEDPVNETIPLTSESNVASKQLEQTRTAQVTITPGEDLSPRKERRKQKSAKPRGGKKEKERKNEGTMGVSVKFLRTKFSH